MILDDLYQGHWAIGTPARWIPKIAEAAGKLRVGPGNAAETDVGPLISKQVAPYGPHGPHAGQNPSKSHEKSENIGLNMFKPTEIQVIHVMVFRWCSFFVACWCKSSSKRWVKQWWLRRSSAWSSWSLASWDRSFFQNPPNPIKSGDRPLQTRSSWNVVKWPEELPIYSYIRCY